MKKCLVFSLFILLFLNFKGIDKNVPPGTVQLNDNLFMDKAEVSNMLWAEYLYAIAKKYGKKSPEYKSALPDSIIWSSVYKSSFNGTGRYKDYPVIGISFEQAQNFCQWRSEAVTIIYHLHKRTKDEKPVYRLPSPQEWEDMYKKDVDKSRSSPEYITVLESVHEVYPSKGKTDFYCLKDNVSEMTSEKGIAMGANWLHPGLDINKTISYSSPSNWLGFRCICELK